MFSHLNTYKSFCFRWSPIGRQLKHYLNETNTFEYPEGLKTRIAHTQLSLEGSAVAGILTKAREREAAKFIDQYNAEPKPQSWLSKFFTGRPEI